MYKITNITYFHNYTATGCGIRNRIIEVSLLTNENIYKCTLGPNIFVRFMKLLLRKCTTYLVLQTHKSGFFSSSLSFLKPYKTLNESFLMDLDVSLHIKAF